MKTMTMVMVCLFLMGCATAQTVGSQYWYKERLNALDAAYEQGEISKEKQLELKNETDQIRNDYIKERKTYYYGQHYGHHYRHHGYHYGYRYSHYCHY